MLDEKDETSRCLKGTRMISTLQVFILVSSIVAHTDNGDKTIVYNPPRRMSLEEIVNVTHGMKDQRGHTLRIDDRGTVEETDEQITED